MIGYYFNLIQQLLFDDKKRRWDFCSGDFYTDIPRVSVQGVESLWGDCRFIPADWGS